MRRNALKKTLEDAGENPWKTDIINDALQSLVHTISSDGEYHKDISTAEFTPSPKPVTVWAPALILRKRSTKGLTDTLREIEECLKNGDDIPAGFTDLAEIRPPDAYENLNDDSDESQSIFSEIYFPKPSNEEQLQIIEKVKCSSGVLVQGPPGTGKSHTIANLICHFLATGQRTLITAKTPRALHVLEGLVPDQLRPLCISLLGTGNEERRSLEASVGGILRKHEIWSTERANQQIKELESNLSSLREEKATVGRRIRAIRESETHSSTVANGAYSGTAAQIAKAVSNDREKYDRFTDTPVLNEACPTTADKLLGVVKNLRLMTPQRRKELNTEWPTELPQPSVFKELIRVEAEAIDRMNDVKSGANEVEAKELTGLDNDNLQLIVNLVLDLRHTIQELLESRFEWMDNALEDILGGKLSTWKKRFSLTKEFLKSTYPLGKLVDDNDISYPELANLNILYTDAIALRTHLEEGGKLGRGLFRPKLVRQRRYILDEVTVNGRTCNTVDDFNLLCKALFVRLETEKAWTYWQEIAPRTQGPYSLQIEELYSMHLELHKALSLADKVETCEKAIGSLTTINTPAWSSLVAVDTLLNTLYLAVAKITLQEVEAKIEGLATYVNAIMKRSRVHPSTVKLYRAICNRDLEVYSEMFDDFDDLSRAHVQLESLDRDVTKIEQALPKLSEKLANSSADPSWDQRLAQIDEAWCWAQARYWIDVYVKEKDAPALHARYEQIEKNISNCIAELASLRAWAFSFSRLNESHRRHMEAWQQSMRKLGKGTGKHAPRHRREAQHHLNECREAVPAWVMPLHRIWDTIKPYPGMFDIVIVDEASQCGFEALPLFFLGKKILIVGDDKQISPEAVGVNRDAVVRNMNEYLYDFEYKSSFHVESSLFDQGRLRYGTSRVTLREHYRCMPEIIRFSNDLCYSDTPLIPLRQYGAERLEPIQSVFVEGGYKKGSGYNVINPPEANMIVDRIDHILADNRYEGKSIGVIVLQGNAQASLIEKGLLDRIGAELIDQRNIICGNPYSFQGGERDIILLSLVADGQNIGVMSRAADERRFNVAASRAKDQMILFHSVTLDDLSDKDMRWKLVEFFTQKHSFEVNGVDKGDLELRAKRDNRSLVRPPDPFESWFEVDVALELVRRGFSVQSQYEIARKRIDLVVEGGHARLAIECDGDHWHGADQYEADMYRQRQLERCGWEFFRVCESAFYVDRTASLESLWQLLSERGIQPQ